VPNYATFRRRAIALVVDIGLLGLVYGACLKALIAATTDSAGQFTNSAAYWIGGGVLTLALVAFLAYCEGVRGATPGKFAMGLRVVDAESGEQIGFWRGIARRFAFVLSELPVLYGFLRMIDDDRRQTWHDELVHSVVLLSWGGRDPRRPGAPA